jgi:hypothetical protein
MTSIESKQRGDTTNRKFNNSNNNKKLNKNNRGEKFVPTFKKRLPTWKQIDNELKELTEKYESVRILIFYYVSGKLDV